MAVTDFMMNLNRELVDNKKVSESSANLYLKTLLMLNGRKPFTSLAFLKKYDDVEERLKAYAANTIKSMLGGIVSVLSLYKDKAGYKKVYQHYYDKMMGTAKAVRESTEPNEKSDTQKDNWVSWDEVNQKKQSLADSIEGFKERKQINLEMYSHLIAYVILSLYTDIPPRRNQDYGMMMVIKKKKELPTVSNYLVLDGKEPIQFVFNKYKTSKTYGQQIIPIPESLRPTIKLYLKFHPLNKGRVAEFPFLVYADGSPMTAVNAITRILNRIFGRKVGSSMLRHIYLSSKYNVDEMAKDAEAMGHSLEEQRKYLRKDGEAGSDKETE